MKVLFNKIAIHIICFILISAVVVLCVFSLSIFNNKYDEIIKIHCKSYGVDYILVKSIIKAESNFSADATSCVGAVGLMQIMPKTAVFISEKLGIYEYDLFDANTNILFGVVYLKYLIDKFPVISTAIAAYNAGEGRVVDWLNDTEYSSDGKFLFNIPYKETSKYVDKVLFYYKIYSVVKIKNSRPSKNIICSGYRPAFKVKEDYLTTGVV